MPIRGSWSCLSGCGWEKEVLDGWQARKKTTNKLNYRTQIFPGVPLEEMKLRREAERTKRDATERSTEEYLTNASRRYIQQIRLCFSEENSQF